MKQISVYTGDSGQLRHRSTDDGRTGEQNETAARDFGKGVLFHYDPDSQRVRCYVQAVASGRSSPEQFIVEYDAEGTFQPGDFRYTFSDEMDRIGWTILPDSSVNMRIYNALGTGVNPFEPGGLVGERLDSLLASDEPLDFGAETKELSVRFFEYLRREFDLDRPVAISNSGRVDHLEDDCLVIKPSQRYGGVQPIEETAALTYRSELDERLTAARETIDDAVGDLVGVEHEERVLARLAGRLNEGGLADMGLVVETVSRLRRSLLRSWVRRFAFVVTLLPLLFLAKRRLEIDPLLAALNQVMVVELSLTIAELSKDTPLVDQTVTVASWQLLVFSGLVLTWSAWPMLSRRSLLDLLPVGGSGGGSYEGVSQPLVDSAVEEIQQGRDVAKKLALSTGASRSDTFATYLQRRVLDEYDLVARGRRAYRMELFLQVALTVLFTVSAAVVLGIVTAATYDVVLENWTLFVKLALGATTLAWLVRVHRFLVERSVLFR